jgi:A/G-specific adenine glycosylase
MVPRSTFWSAAHFSNQYNRFTVNATTRGRIRDFPAFRRALLTWYMRNRRDLPWRRTNDPYRIWLSEIMLQQTRVAVVVERYEQFLKRFPTIKKLAAARETSVLAEWSGLGYYRRARNLHAAAKAVVRDHAGEFPRTSAELKTLPGIGRYTASAIASIAFGEPIAVVDGNVERVISRLFGSTESAVAGVWAIAEQMLCRDNPGDFNQAMMELGATVCLPAEPKCLNCPVRRFCRTQGRHSPGRAKPRQIKREIAYALARKADSVLLTQRASTDSLMPAMWELPQVTLRESDEEYFSLKHSITVTNYTVRVVAPRETLIGTWIKNSRLKSFPLTGLTKKVLRRAGIIQN